MKKTLVLNADFQPLKFVGWKQGLIQTIVDDKTSCYTVEFYDEWVILDSCGREYQIPAVIALKKYVDVGSRNAPYTKLNIFIRDEFICQYCGNKFSREELTVDHVIPRSRWKTLGKGKVSCFENVVACCKSCNSLKADRTCQEANMHPINTPRQVSRREIFRKRLALFDNVPKQWKPYIQGI